MAQTVVVTTTSDLTGTANADTVQFGINGQNYELDLTAAEVKDLEKSLKKYIDVSRTTGKKIKTDAPVRSTTVGLAPATVRAWASSNGVEVPKRGRIPEGVLLKFQEAHI